MEVQCNYSALLDSYFSLVYGLSFTVHNSLMVFKSDSGIFFTHICYSTSHFITLTARRRRPWARTSPRQVSGSLGSNVPSTGTHVR